MLGELPHAYTLMLIPAEHHIHPQGVGAKETGAMAKVLQGAPIHIGTSGVGGSVAHCWEITSPGGHFLADDSTSKCLALRARRRSLDTSMRCWDGASSPVRERGALGGTGPAAAGRLPSACKAGREIDILVPATPIAFQLSPGLGPLEPASAGLVQHDLL